MPDPRRTIEPSSPADLDAAAQIRLPEDADRALEAAKQDGGSDLYKLVTAKPAKPKDK